MVSINESTDTKADFTIDGLIEHLQAYCNGEGITEIDIWNRYHVKEAGIHYVLDHMDLDDTEKEEAKRLFSQRLCLEQFRETITIPSKYLAQILFELKDEINVNSLVQKYPSLSMTYFGDSTIKWPSPFSKENDGPYIEPQDGNIVTILYTAFNRTGEAMNKIFNTGERVALLNKGSKIIVNYVNKMSAPSGPR